MGQEFPSIIGSIVGLVLAILSIKMGLFIPKDKLTITEEKDNEKTISAFKSFMPYGILVILLILAKIILAKAGIPIGIGFKHTLNLFNPGFIFFITGLIVIMIWKIKKETFLNSVKAAFSGAIIPFFVIASMLAMVQIMINSGNNISGIPSAINLIAKTIETSFLPFFAPFAGAFGALMTGSVTTSNIMFGSLFNTASLSMGLNTSIILALLVVGAGIGNMIALADILTVEAVIGEKNAERKVVKGVLVPCLTLLFLVGIIGLIIFKL
jgi:lactate permease